MIDLTTTTDLMIDINKKNIKNTKWKNGRKKTFVSNINIHHCRNINKHYKC